MESGIENKRKHKNKKHYCRTDEAFNLNDVKKNCTGIAAENQDYCSEGDVTFMRNGEENTKSKIKRRKKGKHNEEISIDVTVCANKTNKTT